MNDQHYDNLLADHFRQEEAADKEYTSRFFQICTACRTVYENGAESNVEYYAAQDYSHEFIMCGCQKVAEEEAMYERIAEWEKQPISYMLKKHEVAADILEAIRLFQAYIINARQAINGMPCVYFPQFKAEYLHKIDIYERCIKRLWSRYYKTLNK